MGLDGKDYREGQRVRTNQVFPGEPGVGSVFQAYEATTGRPTVYAVKLDDGRLVAAFRSELDPE